jgi:hypothetical protein
MSEIPDLTMWLQLHGAMRTSGDQLAAALADVPAGDRRRAQALSQWFAGFDAELHHHHMVEDEIFFPALVARVPTYLESSGPEIEADHERLDQLLAALRGSLARLAGDGEWAVSRGEAYALASELAALLHRHLGLEDQDVLPLYCRHFTAEEYQALHDEAAKTMALRQAWFTVPWLMTHLDAKRRVEVFEEAPGIMRLVWRLSRRGYARRAALALAGEVRLA